jgi:RNA polymerase sigma-B factor
VSSLSASAPSSLTGAGVPKARERETRLFRRYARFGDLRAREELFHRLFPLARKLASRYLRAGESPEDILQVAAIGLLKAIDRFDPEQGIAFPTFATPTILGELRRHFRDHAWAIRVSRSDQERVIALSAVSLRLSAQLRRSPTSAEIASATGWTREQVLEALELAGVGRPVSLDERVEGATRDSSTLTEVLGDVDTGFARVEDRAALFFALRRLPERERQVLVLYFFEGLKQSEIGDRIGISQMHVSRILQRALKRANALVHGTRAG